MEKWYVVYGIAENRLTQGKDLNEIYRTKHRELITPEEIKNIVTSNGYSNIKEFTIMKVWVME
jgi:hypothetical protein